MQFIQVDTRNDNESTPPGTFRKERLYDNNISHYAIEYLLDGDATRDKLSHALKERPNWMLTCCSHGEYDEILGYNNNELLQVPEKFYNGELERVIHLKCCYAAEQLGPYLVAQGCWAFFGYNIQFGFPSSSENSHLQGYFFEPDLKLVEVLAEGATAKSAHAALMDCYVQMEDELLKLGNPGNYIGVLNYNKKHFCSPSTDKSFGEESATIDNPGYPA